jgi:SpoVK/Ycf46/Vps4 family AAA+-type ATPase
MKHLDTYLKAGYACLNIVSHEEHRVTGELMAVITGMEYAGFTWTCVDGVRPFGKKGQGEPIQATADPNNALAAFAQTLPGPDGPEGKIIPNKSVVLLKDFHLFLKTANPQFIRRMKDAIDAGRATNRHLVVIGCRMHIPPELEKEITVIEFGLPDRPALLKVAQQLAKSRGLKLNGSTDDILDAGSGLTTAEFADAVAWSLVKENEIKAPIISTIKAEAIKKGGIMEVIDPKVTFDDIGGLANLKNFILKRRHAFSPKAREFGVPLPKGLLLLGVQGGGKSFATRAIASTLGGPLLRLDAGRLFGGIVGQSEGNVRSVIEQVEAFGKCTLWIDEIDKGFAGMVGGHDGDSGTTRRVIGTMLTWMAEKTSPVFIVATANDVTRLPPEMLRKGRWDELIFVDLPTHSERIEIWAVQIRRYGRKPENYNLQALAACTVEWTGAEIEALYRASIYHAFEAEKDPWTELLISLSKRTVPLSKTMAEPMKALRDWAKGRAMAASEPEETNVQVMERKLA